jgi:hypothetical protein
VKPFLPTSSTKYVTKTEPSGLKPMKNSSDHADLTCELLTSFLIRGTQVGEMIRLVKHAIWPIPCNSNTSCYFQFPKY